MASIQLPPAQPFDPDMQLTACAYPGCTVTKPRGHMRSFVVSCAQTGDGRVPSHGCDEQHYGCNVEHALAVAIACAEQHVAPKLAALVASADAADAAKAAEKQAMDLALAERRAALEAMTPPDA